jgi:hypothetical protein
MFLVYQKVKRVLHGNRSSIKNTDGANNLITHKIMDIMDILQHDICTNCNQMIHPNFVGYHKCGYANCPVCKTGVTNSGYWYHLRSHPGHENDNPPPPRQIQISVQEEGRG